MRRLPFGFEPFQVLPHLYAALAHQRVERLELRHLSRYRVESEVMSVEHRRELRAGGDHGRPERADRALLLEHRRRIQRPPRTCRPNPGADLHMDVAVRVTRAGSAVRDADDLHVLDWYDFLLPARPDTRHRVLSEPPLNLG